MWLPEANFPVFYLDALAPQQPDFLSRTSRETTNKTITTYDSMAWNGFRAVLVERIADRTACETCVGGT